MMAMQPVRVLLSRLFSGKYGSSAPVTGFLMVIGAMAVNSGRGRSCGGQKNSVHELLQICIMYELAYHKLIIPALVFRWNKSVLTTEVLTSHTSSVTLISNDSGGTNHSNVSASVFYSSNSLTVNIMPAQHQLLSLCLSHLPTVTVC